MAKGHFDIATVAANTDWTPSKPIKIFNIRGGGNITRKASGRSVTLNNTHNTGYLYASPDSSLRFTNAARISYMELS